MADIEKLVAALKERAPESKPKVDDLAKWAELSKVSGAERDEAWQQYQAAIEGDGGNAGEIECVMVRTKAPGRRRRRAGFAFTDKPTLIALEVFSKEELKAIEDDQALRVEHVTAPAADVTEV